jgi:Protein of unknown function (DUF2637)
VALTNDTPQGLDTPPAAGWDTPYEDTSGVQPQFAAQAAPTRPSRDAGRAMRLVALVAVVIGLAAVTAAACVLSYSSMHHLAIQAGVSARLASVYPLIFDALLVLAGCSVLALRGAGLGSRVYGWVCMLLLLGGLAAGGALNAAAIKIPHRLAGVVAAIVPWVLVLIGFGLLLVLLRYARSRGLGQNHAKASAVQEAAALPSARQADLQLRARIPRQPAHEQIEADPAPDDPDAAGQPENELNPAPTPDSSGGEAGGPPAFMRTRSSPTPPEE